MEVGLCCYGAKKKRGASDLRDFRSLCVLFCLSKSSKLMGQVTNHLATCYHDDTCLSYVVLFKSLFYILLILKAPLKYE